MTRRVYDASLVLEGAANWSPLLVMLPAGAHAIVLSLCSEAEWRSKWAVGGQPLTDEQWDIVAAVAAGIPAAIEDGEEVNELANAVRYLADTLEDSSLTLRGGVGAGGCCFDLITDPASSVDGRGDGFDYDGWREAIGEAVVDSFTDDGVSTYPDGFDDRAGYVLAKCTVANALYRDFKTTLVQLQILDVIAIVATAAALGSALFSSGGALSGMIAAGVSAPVAALTLIAFFLSLIALGVNVGKRLRAIGEQLDQQAVVCAFYSASNASAAKAGLYASVQDAHDAAIAAGVFAYSELFEERLFELLEVLVPSETYEALFSVADAASQAVVAAAGDLDCATACSGTVGGELFTVTDFAPYAGTSIPDLTPFGEQVGLWYRTEGNAGGTGGSLDIVDDYVINNAAGTNARATHDFVLTVAGDLVLSFWRSGTVPNANVICYLQEWQTDAWVTIQTVPATASTGFTSAGANWNNVQPGLYRCAFRLNGEDNAKFRDPSLIFTPN